MALFAERSTTMRTKEQIRQELNKIADEGIAAAKRGDFKTSVSLVPKAQALMRELNDPSCADLIERGDDLVRRYKVN